MTLELKNKQLQHTYCPISQEVKWSANRIQQEKHFS